MASFCEIALHEFEFLEREFGYEVIEVNEKNDEIFIKYINRDAGVGVKPLYDSRCSYVFVFIYRLVDGEFRDNPRPIGSDTDITCFDFDDYLSAVLKMKSANEYGEDSEYYDPQDGFRKFVKEFARRLQTCGQEILKGDLSILPAMAAIIKYRAEVLKET